MTREQKNNDDLVRAFTCPKGGRHTYIGLKTREQVHALAVANVGVAAYWYQAK